jgi:predicted nucleic acid-binding protein
MNLFIDTNIFLGFYHLSNEDLEELRKLSVLLKEKKVTLYLPKQVIHEFERNRESKIADALKRFREEKLNDQFPQICKEYEELYQAMREAITQFAKAKIDLLEQLTIDIEARNLKADKCIKELFNKALVIDITGDVLEQAKTRFDLGNPPGKNKSYGDSVNWESLLNACPVGEEIYFITDDKDYFSEVCEDRFSSFLLEEWREKKKSELVFLRRLSSFFKEKFPQIKMAVQLEKELLISDLRSSGTFANTKQILRKLSKFSDFTDSELNEIVSAAISNRQIYWISGDFIVRDTLSKIVEGNESRIDSYNLVEFNKWILGRDENSSSAFT